MPGGPLGGRRTVGRLRHRVTIQTPAAAANAYGELQPQTWSDLATAWCQVTAASGRLSKIAKLLFLAASA